MNKKNANKLNQVNQKLDKVIKLEKQQIKPKRRKGKKTYKNMQTKYTEQTSGIIPFSIQTNPNKMRGFPVNRTQRLLDDYAKYNRLQYIMGALHPQLAYENRWDIRYPSILPVPTACVRVMSSHALTTGTLGQLYINYVPGTLIGSNIANFEASGITQNTTCNGAGVAGSNVYLVQPCFPVPRMWDRYRLVAAEIKVTYTGNVFDRKGTIYGGVHYEPASIAVRGSSGSGTINSIANSNVDRFSSNLGLVKNQLWSETRVLTENELHMSYVWTPDSASNLLYPGYIPSSGSEGIVVNSTSANLVTQTTAAGIRTNLGSSSQVGPDRNINFFMVGLPATNQCVRVDIYEIFEYIPDVSALNIVTTSMTRMEVSDVQQISKVEPSSLHEPKIK